MALNGANFFEPNLDTSGLTTNEIVRLLVNKHIAPSPLCRAAYAHQTGRASHDYLVLWFRLHSAAVRWIYASARTDLGLSQVHELLYRGESAAIRAHLPVVAKARRCPFFGSVMATLYPVVCFCSSSGCASGRILSSYRKELLNMNKLSVRLLLAAAVLLLIAGTLFGFTQSWIYAGLIWSGAFGCLIAALNFENAKKDDDNPDE